ncbi:helix-turn-helix domain-containing protein [Deinococcus ruber]|uniref:HTH cro/C1-type domain-containing protein n=1 Tax=Deinococcus ruber TaxID=1848197 RepID=A0A918FER7_9DEIO|nr:helix-turn-helix transcriptional regulator [Deinococcus ruber]GGR31164.1 hypothetical protein GCM10008957_47260 [Deinococcus ruber]
MTLYAPPRGFPMPPSQPYESPALDARQKVGFALRRARKDAGLTLAQAAERSGLSRSTIGSIERGEHDLASVAGKNMMLLHEAFGLRQSEFEKIISPVYGNTPRYGSPVPPIAAQVELPLTIPPELQEVIDEHAKNYPELRDETMLRIITAPRDFGGADHGPQSAEEWFEYFLLTRKYIRP